MKKIILFLLAVGILISCHQEKKDSTENKKITPDTLAYSSDSVVVESKNIIKVDEKSAENATKATINFPVFKTNAINDYIKKQVFGYIGKDEQVTSYQDIANSFVKGYDEFYLENKDRKESWWLNIDIKVIYQKSDYIALEYINSDFSGGAHPNTYFSYLNYNLKTNQAIVLDSLIEPTKKQQLTTLAETIFRKDENLSPTASLAGKYFFKDDKFALPENFYVNAKGLVFLYNPYEIKPYVDGITKLTIPLTSLKGIAKPNTILTSTN